MYIYDKLVASDSDNILVIGQPMSGMTFAACKYAIEKAYEGKSVYIFKDNPAQLSDRLQGGIKELFNSLKSAYLTIRGPYSGSVTIKSLYNSGGRGAGGDVVIYDNCQTLFTSLLPTEFKQEIVLSYYKYLIPYMSNFSDAIEATTKENVIGCKNNPSYIAMLEALSKEDYKDLMELPSHSEKNSKYTIPVLNNEDFDSVFHNTIGGQTIYVNSDGSIVIKSGKSRVEIDSGGNVKVDGVKYEITCKR
jgi:hypothetical protein